MIPVESLPEFGELKARGWIKGDTSEKNINVPSVFRPLSLDLETFSYTSKSFFDLAWVGVARIFCVVGRGPLRKLFRCGSCLKAESRRSLIWSHSQQFNSKRSSQELCSHTVLTGDGTVFIR